MVGFWIASDAIMRQDAGGTLEAFTLAWLNEKMWTDLHVEFESSVLRTGCIIVRDQGP